MKEISFNSLLLLCSYFYKSFSRLAYTTWEFCHHNVVYYKSICKKVDVICLFCDSKHKDKELMNYVLKLRRKIFVNH